MGLTRSVGNVLSAISSTVGSSNWNVLYGSPQPHSRTLRSRTGSRTYRIHFASPRERNILCRLTIRWTAQGPGSSLLGMVEQAPEINCLRWSFSMGPERSAKR
jgi:hypothetical protein